MIESKIKSMASSLEKALQELRDSPGFGLSLVKLAGEEVPVRRAAHRAADGTQRLVIPHAACVGFKVNNTVVARSHVVRVFATLLVGAIYIFTPVFVAAFTAESDSVSD